MNKKMLAFGILILFVAIVFSGCNEQQSEQFEDTNNIDLVDYSVISYKFGKDIGDPNIKLGDGFNYKEDMVGFKVSGSMINNEGEPLSKIKVIGNFYYGTQFLGSDETIIEKCARWRNKGF
ncbi:MAG: hypothetical protein ACFFDN_52405 [Candidatus Hodarchaeota archaeon]